MDLAAEVEAFFLIADALDFGVGVALLLIQRVAAILFAFVAKIDIFTDSGRLKKSLDWLKTSVTSSLGRPSPER